MLKILIADDHSVVRIGIRFVLKEHFEEIEIYEARNGDELIATLKQNPVDVILMDLNMPNTDPQRTLQTILILKPAVGVIIFSMNKEEIFGMMYMEMGAKSYLKKDCTEQELVQAIDAVSKGGTYVTKGMETYYAAKNGHATHNPFEVLTKKELEVLRHLAKGESMQQICRVMHISSSTAGTHKANILAKLRVTNLFELHAITELYPLES